MIEKKSNYQKYYVDDHQNDLAHLAPEIQSHFDFWKSKRFDVICQGKT
jgi:hypothetical protein